jgi:hypothetical protein
MNTIETIAAKFNIDLSQAARIVTMVEAGDDSYYLGKELCETLRDYYLKTGELSADFVNSGGDYRGCFLNSKLDEEVKNAKP